MLKNRIEILLNAHVISKPSADFVCLVIDLLPEQEIESGKMEMFTTHLAMATERIIKKEDIDCLSEEIWQQIVQHDQFEKAKLFGREIALKSPIQIPSEEMQYLVMHLCNLFSQ